MVNLAGRGLCGMTHSNDVSAMQGVTIEEAWAIAGNLRRTNTRNTHLAPVRLINFRTDPAVGCVGGAGGVRRERRIAPRCQIHLFGEVQFPLAQEGNITGFSKKFRIVMPSS